MYRSKVARETFAPTQASCLVCPFFHNLIAALILELNETFGELFAPLTRLSSCLLPIAQGHGVMEKSAEQHPKN
jgi:hypothetical protein